MLDIIASDICIGTNAVGRVLELYQSTLNLWLIYAKMLVEFLVVLTISTERGMTMEIKWKSIDDLIEVPTDAIDYNTIEGQKALQRIFINNDNVGKIKSQRRYYIVGDKGTGKTAYALYLQGQSSEKQAYMIKNMQDTTYDVFVQLKKNNLLTISDYEDVWRVILLLLVCEEVRQNEDSGVWGQKLKQVNRAIDEFYSNAFNPEIQYAINIVKESKAAVNVFSKIDTEHAITMDADQQKMQIDLMYLEKKFKEALLETELKKEYILFVDGIDARPSSVEFEDYMECVKGLINAVWTLNTSVFAMSNKQSQLKIMLLIRPDIFDKAGMHNMNNKIKNNTVMLEWKTSYAQFAKSGLFRIADQLLRTQQENYESIPEGAAWNHYFPYCVYNYHTKSYSDNSFIYFLRYSFYRPRDIVAMMEAMRVTEKDKVAFSADTFFSQAVKQATSEYLLGEIRDNLSFYYENSDFDLFRRFFENHLIGKMRNERFDYQYYCDCFADFISQFRSDADVPYIFKERDSFLQLLYEQNIIAWIEEDRGCEYQKWYFKERTYSNIRPRIRTHCKYKIHTGIARALGYK